MYQILVVCDGNSNRNNQKMSENCRKCVILHRACYLKVLPIWINGRVGPVVSWYHIPWYLRPRRPKLNSQLNKFSLISLLFRFLFPSHTTNLYLSEITVNRLPKGIGVWSKDKMRQLVVVISLLNLYNYYICIYMYIYISNTFFPVLVSHHWNSSNAQKIKLR